MQTVIRTAKRPNGRLGASTGRVGQSYGTPRVHPRYVIEPCPACGFPEADGGYCPECGWSLPLPNSWGGRPLHPANSVHGR